MIEAILFDLDGVLVSTDVFHFQAWKALANRLGIPFTQEQGDRCRGVSRMDSLDIVLEGSRRCYSLQEKQELAQEKNLAYCTFLERMTPADVPEQVRSTLLTLRERGYRLALASGSKNAGLILQRTGLRQLLDAVADGTCITRSKPDPEVFLTAAKLVGVAPEGCAAVDDALAGIQAGARAGMVTVAMADAARHGAGTYNIQHLDQLLALFPVVERREVAR